jgi:hypothetical protein
MPSALSLHSTTVSDTRSLREEISNIVHGLIHDFFDPYRPERHYMRGPGPKWRKKHQGTPAMQRSAGARAAFVRAS